MMANNKNISEMISENEEKFVPDIPESFFNKLFDLCGSRENGRGYILCALDRFGNPVVYQKSQSMTIELGLQKYLYNCLSRQEKIDNADIPFDDIEDGLGEDE